MSKLISVLFLIGLVGFAFADGDEHNSREKGHALGSEYLEAEIEATLAQVRDKEIGAFTVGEVEALMGQISVLRQKSAYIQKSAGASFMLPGVGQMMNGAVLNGALLLTADLLLSAGAIVGGYFLLPEELRFGQLDYLNTPMVTIKERWHSRSIAELLPSVGVTAAGGLVQMVLRVFASKQAADLAQKKIAAGGISFEPTLLSPAPGNHGIRLGLRMKH